VIAPETCHILADCCRLIEQQNKILLTSPSSVVQLTGNKLETIKRLQQFDIAVVPSALLADDLIDTAGSWVIKPIDGVGCEGCEKISDQHGLQRLKQELEDQSKYIIQPYIEGKSISLSCLFKKGISVLICCNEQKIERLDGRFYLTACEVNIAVQDQYHHLVNAIAKALPELWGYVGIDLLETADQQLVLEINPRLTTSYAGIKQATGINVAAKVLGLLNAELEPIKHSKNRQVMVTIPRKMNICSA
jgi:predicted ATP-grasp superfamily ATP-dependent carboligase